ncbi:MAG: hypothetical protein ACYDFT_00655 [Thermoplasmata archaeon]
MARARSAVSSALHGRTSRRRSPAARRRLPGPRSRISDRTSRGRPAPVVPGSIPRPREGAASIRIEHPRSQAVCRGCGRILEVALAIDELTVLSALAERAPEGWRVDGISFTLMGACRKCREGDRGTES